MRAPLQCPCASHWISISWRPPTIPLMTQSQQNPEIQRGISVLFLHVTRHAFQILAAAFLVKTCLVEVESADPHPPLTQQVSECPYRSRMAAATQTYECVLVWKYCRQPLAIKLGRSRALYFTCLFGAVTPTSAFQDLATIYLFLPIEGNIQGFFFHGGELTVNRPAFVSSASTDSVALFFPHRCFSKQEFGGVYIYIYIHIYR